MAVTMDIGKVIDNYLIEEKLGEGSFGIVYKSKNLSNKTNYALKMLKTWQLPDEVKINLEKRFELEYETGKISSKNLVRTHHLHRFCDVPYFTMDFCSNGNLQHKLHKSKINNQQCSDYASGILYGLHDLHQHGKIHRDLKPENVLFDADDTPKLTDFGIAGHINIQLTVVNKDDSPEHILGSYAYMAPEQLRSVKRQNTLLPTVDIFAFGVVCYEMFTGHLPFGQWKHTSDISEYMSKAANGNIDDPLQYNMTMPFKWINTIEKCLQPDREKRYQTVTNILQDLDHALESESHKSQYRGVLRFTVLNGDEPGLIYTINTLQKKLIKIGRKIDGLQNDVSIDEKYSSYISRRQATIELIESEIYLRDGQWNSDTKEWQVSKNGTYINGKPTDQHGSMLNENDIIYIGNTTIRINF